MAYKLMVIDDRPERQNQYRKVLDIPEFDPLYVWTPGEFEQNRNTPVDGYIIDVFLDQNGWDTNAAELLRNTIETAPRPAPVFLVSQLWGEEKILGILKRAGESSAKVVQYLAWTEFDQSTVETSSPMEMDCDAATGRMNALRKKLLFELDRWHGRSGFRPGPDDDIRILLLADVQYGDPATAPGATFAEHWIADTLRAANKLPDLIAIAGDLSHSGRPDQYALAEERLTLDLMGKLWGSNNIERYRDRIVLVPGNHDVNLRFSACDSHKFNVDRKEFEAETMPLDSANNERYLRHHDYALEPFRRFAHRLTGDRNWVNSPKLTWVDRRFIHCGIRFFVLNSVEELNAASPKRATINEDSVRNITRSIEDDESGAVFSIALSHHGFRHASTSEDEVQVDNWNKVAGDLFSLHKIRLWLYGHYHKFVAYSLNSEPFSKKPLWLVQAPTLRIGSASRGFCLLELKRKSGTVQNAFIQHYELVSGETIDKGRYRVFGKG